MNKGQKFRQTSLEFRIRSLGIGSGNAEEKPSVRDGAAVETAEIVWKQNCLRHSFCSYAVALKGLEWTSDQGDHSIAILKRDYREVVTKADAEAYFDIAV